MVDRGQQLTRLEELLAAADFGVLQLIASDSEVAVVVDALLDQSPPLTHDEQRAVFAVCSQHLPLTRLLLSGDLQRLPQLLRLGLYSSVLYVGGVVMAPEQLIEELEQMVEELGSSWSETSMDPAVALLSNQTIDLEVLVDEFAWPGDSKNLEAMLQNPSLPAVLLERFIDGDHSIFEDLRDGAVEETRVHELRELATEALELGRGRVRTDD